MKILIDTREQQPFIFARYGVETVRGTLATGDYCVEGFESRISIERKGSLDELVLCLSSDRGRFERELQRAATLDFFAIVIEGSFVDLMAGRFRSRMTVNAVVESIAAFTVRHRTSFLFCGGRLQAERLTYSLLSKFEREQRLKGSAGCGQGGIKSLYSREDRLHA